MITIKLFPSGERTPRFVGQLQLCAVGSAPADECVTADLKLLWDVERAINDHIAGRCHIEINSDDDAPTPPSAADAEPGKRVTVKTLDKTRNIPELKGKIITDAFINVLHHSALPEGAHYSLNLSFNDGTDLRIVGWRVVAELLE